MLERNKSKRKEAVWGGRLSEPSFSGINQERMGRGPLRATRISGDQNQPEQHLHLYAVSHLPSRSYCRGFCRGFWTHFHSPSACQPPGMSHAPSGSQDTKPHGILLKNHGPHGQEAGRCPKKPQGSQMDFTDTLKVTVSLTQLSGLIRLCKKKKLKQNRNVLQSKLNCLNS